MKVDGNRPGDQNSSGAAVSVVPLRLEIAAKIVAAMNTQLDVIYGYGASKAISRALELADALIAAHNETCE